ncbi:hypothetical protein ACFLSX_05605 [Calditrichota bacterium]
MKYFILGLILVSQLFGQVLFKDGFKLKKESLPSGDSETILGNGIVDILIVQDSIVFAGTGYGLNMTVDKGQSWSNFTSKNYKGKGGVSAMALMGESTVWIATAYDTLIREDNLSAGGGLSYTSDFGETWYHIPQPRDPNLSSDSLGYSPTTTNVQNLSYDIAVLDSTIWIASFGGGLRKSEDMGQTWRVKTTDGLPFSSLNHLNHRAFSLLTENGNIWVGTAHGISKSSNAGATWDRFTHQNQTYPISGNFVVALGYQQYVKSSGDTIKTIWAATIEATDGDEVRAVSKSVNGGETWEVMLEGTFPHNFAFDDSIVYVAADEGLFISNNGRKNWYNLPPILDPLTGEEVLTETYYSAGISHHQLEKLLWVGSADGLASTYDNGNTWKVHRSYQSTQSSSAPNAYAYPSPFSPSRHDYIRFQYDIQQAGEVVIDVYDFAMDKVASIKEYESSPMGNTPDRSAKWDGRNSKGDVAASGVYFFRVKVASEVTWGKLVIIN